MEWRSFEACPRVRRDAFTARDVRLVILHVISRQQARPDAHARQPQRWRCRGAQPPCAAFRHPHPPQPALTPAARCTGRREPAAAGYFRNDVPPPPEFFPKAAATLSAYARPFSTVRAAAPPAAAVF